MMNKSKIDPNEIFLEEVLRDEMINLRIRIDSISETPIIMRLLMDLALRIDNKCNDQDLGLQDYLDSTSTVNGWITDLERLLKENIH